MGQLTTGQQSLTLGSLGYWKCGLLQGFKTTVFVCGWCNTTLMGTKKKSSMVVPGGYLYFQIVLPEENNT